MSSNCFEDVSAGMHAALAEPFPRAAASASGAGSSGPGRALARAVFLFGISIAVGLTSGCDANKAGKRPAGDVDRARLAAADSEPENWFTGGRDGNFTYYSPLHQINRSNAREVGFAWSTPLGTTSGLEATPVAVDGVLYTSGAWGRVYALDGTNGRLLWTFTPKVDDSVVQHACCDIVNRGVAVWKGRVFVGTLDGKLVALDAKSGGKLWQVDTIVDHHRAYSITGAPYIAGDLVVIGNSGAEYDARGYFTAYDSATGKLAWRFYTVPASKDGPFENPELAMAAATWSKDTRWEAGLGGTVWDGMAYDPDLDLLYVGTGNSALYPRQVRSPGGGDNLFVSSILAIKARTGRLAWHYQETPGDQWDYTATQKLILATLTIGGRSRKVIMQAPKNGFFYVLDRETGELISARPYVTVNWASGIDATGRPIETGQGDYSQGPKLVFPSPAGGHSWQPMAYNPKTGLVYIPTFNSPAIFWPDKSKFKYVPGGVNMHVGIAFPARGDAGWGLASPAARSLPPLAELARGQPAPTMRGILKAWDPVRGKVVWEVDTSGQWRDQMNALWNGGGVMTSAGGLVVQGRSSGELYFYDAEDGREVGKLNVGTGMMAAPMTYSVDGVQYIAIMAGSGGLFGRAYDKGTAAQRFGNANRIVAFKLGGGKVPLPALRTAQPKASTTSAPPVARFGTPTQRSRGEELYEQHCNICHKNAGGGGIPDLTRMTAATYKEFDDILFKGTRADKGMADFSATLSRQDVHDLKAALTDRAWQAYERRCQDETGNGC